MHKLRLKVKKRKRKRKISLGNSLDFYSLILKKEIEAIQNENEEQRKVYAEEGDKIQILYETLTNLQNVEEGEYSTFKKKHLQRFFQKKEQKREKSGTLLKNGKGTKISGNPGHDEFLG